MAHSIKTETDRAHVRLTDAALRQTVGALLDAVLDQATRGELAVLRVLLERTLAARAARQERAA